MYQLKKEIMLTAQGITYIHPDKELLFKNINFSIRKKDKVALIGNNGTGKSTLLKIIAGVLQPSHGDIKSISKPYYIPQHFGQFNDSTIAKALRIEDKLNTLNRILNGDVSDKNLTLLNNDWDIEERVKKALFHWELKGLPLSYKMKDLSGGEKTKVFLAGIIVHQPHVILLDEPTNHLDNKSRNILYNYISSCNNSIVTVSHDRKLLQLLNPVYELSKQGLKCYGGNYSFYKEQKEIEQKALFHQLEEKEKTLQKVKKAERESLERKQRQDARGKKKKQKAGVSRIMMKKLKNNAEQSSAKLKEKHSEKTKVISKELKETRQKLPDISKIKMDFESSTLHIGKVLVTIENINFKYNGHFLWPVPLSFQVRSGERINIKGENGSGKTTLIKIILGELQPSTGFLHRTEISSVYVDQDYSLIKNKLTVYEQAELYNHDLLEEHDIKIRLNRYLFGRDFWDKPCSTLSGGEKMRLILCCLMISNHAPDLFVLDEPTNNLDIENIEILTSTISVYRGTVLVVSHDSTFLEEIGINHVIDLDY